MQSLLASYTELGLSQLTIHLEDWNQETEVKRMKITEDQVYHPAVHHAVEARIR